MSFSFANPWWHIGGLMGLPAYVLLRLAWQKLKRCSAEPQKEGRSRSLAFYFRLFRWYPVAAVLAFGVSVALVVGLHRNFIGVETSDTEIVLDYPWPRTDVHLRLQDTLLEAGVESARFGIWGTTKFRLKIKSGAAEYRSLWIGDFAELRRARDSIQLRLTKSKER